MPTLKTQRLDLFVNFVACARGGNLTRAAADVGLSRTALWQQFQLLQRTYRVTLFRRTRYGLALTPDGVHFLAVVEPLVAAFRALPTTFEERRRGRGPVLRVACPDSIEENELVPVMERFRAENPDTRVEVIETQSRGVPGLVASGEATVGIEVDPTDVSAGGLRYVPLYERRVFVAVRERHPLATGRLTLTRLAQHPFAAEPVGSRLRGRVERAFAAAGLESGHRIELESSSERVLLAAVLGGRAITAVSARTVPTAPTGVRFLAAGHLFGRMPVYLVSRSSLAGPTEATFEATLVQDLGSVRERCGR
ncbi:MAG: hypothetical protein C0467_31425 [Planctomycetaceae bacterium]|nr:hypothetical protein [Planctomycetaceae bacterium]